MCLLFECLIDIVDSFAYNQGATVRTVPYYVHALFFQITYVRMLTVH